jgi:thiol-disulfide isomerase/thioredoxin
MSAAPETAPAARNRVRLLVAAGTVALLPAGLGAANGASPGYTITAWPAGRTPPLKLADLGGSAWSLEQHAGKVVLVNFWATWCEPCRAEMPSLQALADRLGPDRLVVVGVNYQEPEMRIQRFLGANPAIKFAVLLDRDGTAARAWTRRIFPTSVLVGPDGRARSVITGEFDWAAEAAEKMVRDLLPR